MIYRVLAAAVLLLHLGFILFVMAGAALVVRRRRLWPLHVAAVAWGIAIEVMGGACPLTALENRLRLLAGTAGYAGGFVDHYLVALIYPAGLTRGTQWLLAAAVLGVNAVLYARILRDARLAGLDAGLSRARNRRRGGRSNLRTAALSAREIVMENIFVRSWWVPALRGLLGIVFAVLAVAWPGLTLLTLVALFAAYAILGGIASLAGALRHRTGGEMRWDAVILGLVSIGAGLVAAYHPAATALLLVLIMGANALVVGVLDILAAIRLRRAIAGEWMLALAGLASIVFGALVFARPGAGAVALVWFVSLYAFVTGVLLLALGVRMRALGRTAAAEHDRRVLPDRRMSPAR
ncbi:DUF2784 family protein [Massilia rhizosphaerae]|uniref:DUF2784 family protein n=1 Tax=Massilia rhizosphaerae TaxID=2784389 RepID=UPI0027D9BBE3|nr:DUF2784 family protein [Massilia rhizosphaerae]